MGWKWSILNNGFSLDFYPKSTNLASSLIVDALWVDVGNEFKEDDDDEWSFEGKGWGVWILFLSEFAWNPFPVPDQLVNMKVDSDDQEEVLYWMII